MSSPRDVLPGAPQFGDDDARIAYNRVFFALLRIERTLILRISRKLRDMGVADPVWYEILLATEEAGDDGIQMLALQKRLFLQQYALSRHIARLEKDGLIRREAARGVGRGQTIFLTEKARGLQERIWQVYVAEIHDSMAPQLTTDEAYALVRMLNRLYV